VKVGLLKMLKGPAWSRLEIPINEERGKSKEGVHIADGFPLCIDRFSAFRLTSKQYPEAQK